MSRPFSSRHAPSGPSVRINGKIRAREVRVIGDEGQQLGVLPLSEAISLARSRGVDLVEVAPNASPPVCRVVDFGKFKYEQEKRQKESRKHHHANKVKEIQLSATIDPHDFQTKLGHAVDFLCEEMKVKASLRFRGREMAHTEFGFDVVRRFLREIGPWGHPDFEPKLNGRSINVMISPLPRNKRARHPDESRQGGETDLNQETSPAFDGEREVDLENASQEDSEDTANGPEETPRAGGFSNSPFEGLKIAPPGQS